MSKAEVELEELIYMNSHEYDSVKALMELDAFYYQRAFLDKEKIDLAEKYNKLFGHLDMVRENCRKLGFALIAEGQYELAHELMIASSSHDLSKFFSIEWDYLCDPKIDMDDPRKKDAIKKHVFNNNHHPEFHHHRKGIHGMKDGDVAEMVVDWYCRGIEFGRPIRDFMEEKAFEKYGFNEASPIFQKMNYYYKLLTGSNI